MRATKSTSWCPCSIRSATGSTRAMEMGSPTSRGSLLYLPLSPSGSGGDGGDIDCVEIRRSLQVAKLLPMLFAAMSLTIVDAVATVANNINSNNNNNNNQV